MLRSVIIFSTCWKDWVFTCLLKLWLIFLSTFVPSCDQLQAILLSLLLCWIPKFPVVVKETFLSLRCPNFLSLCGLFSFTRSPFSHLLNWWHLSHIQRCKQESTWSLVQFLTSSAPVCSRGSGLQCFPCRAIQGKSLVVESASWVQGNSNVKTRN